MKKEWSKNRVREKKNPMKNVREREILERARKLLPRKYERGVLFSDEKKSPLYGEHVSRRWKVGETLPLIEKKKCWGGVRSRNARNGERWRKSWWFPRAREVPSKWSCSSGKVFQLSFSYIDMRIIILNSVKITTECAMSKSTKKIFKKSVVLLPPRFPVHYPDMDWQKNVGDDRARHKEASTNNHQRLEKARGAGCREYWNGKNSKFGGFDAQTTSSCDWCQGWTY